MGVEGTLNVVSIGQLGKQSQIRFTCLAEHKISDRHLGTGERFRNIDFLVQIGLHCLPIDGFNHRRHDEQGHDQRQAD